MPDINFLHKSYFEKNRNTPLPPDVINSIRDYYKNLPVVVDGVSYDSNYGIIHFFGNLSLCLDDIPLSDKVVIDKGSKTFLVNNQFGVPEKLGKLALKTLSEKITKEVLKKNINMDAKAEMFIQANATYNDVDINWLG